MNAQQIAWAARHDWFLLSEGAEVVVRGDIGEPAELRFRDFDALRAWAGY